MKLFNVLMAFIAVQFMRLKVNFYFKFYGLVPIGGADGETTTTLDAILKDIYAKPIQNELVNDNPVLDLFEKQEGQWGGRKITYPVQVRRNQAAMSTTENGTLPDAGATTTVKTEIPIKFTHGRIQLSVQIIKASRSDEYAFKKGLNLAMTDMVDGLRRYKSRAMFGTGRGILCLLNGDPGTGTTFTVDAPGGVAGAVNGARFLQIGMYVTPINPTGPATRAAGAYQITAIATNGQSVTIDRAADAVIADNDYLVRVAKLYGAAVDPGIGNTSIDNDPMGLLGLIDDGTNLVTLHGISRTTYPSFGSYVFASTGALSADVLQRGLDVAYERGDGKPGVIICGTGFRRAYLTLMEAERRYTSADLKNPDAGTTAAKMGQITFGDIPFIVDRDAPYGTGFGVDKSSFTRWVEIEGEWADDDGPILMRMVDKDAYEARYRIFDNFSNDHPNKSVRWDGVTTSEVVIHVE